MYYRARYYAGSVGRFISADTLVPQASDPQSWNRYSYTRNRPLNAVDPSGHTDIEFIDGMGGAGFGGPGTGSGVDAESWEGFGDLTSYKEVGPEGKVPFDPPTTEVPTGGETPSGEVVSESASNDAGVPGATGSSPSAEIHGQAQVTSGNHDQIITENATELAKSGDWDDIYLNKSLKTTTNGEVMDYRRPDLIAVRGRDILIMEVQSMSQSVEYLKGKLNSMSAALAQAGWNVIPQFIPK